MKDVPILMLHAMDQAGIDVSCLFRIFHPGDKTGNALAGHSGNVPEARVEAIAAPPQTSTSKPVRNVAHRASLNSW